MKTSDLLKRFIEPNQYKFLASMLRESEEKEAIKEILKDLKQTILKTPVTYETDGQGKEAIAYIHYFKGGSDWYITELDTNHETTQYQAFGYTSLHGGDFEAGYISIEELKSCGIEIDLYFTPQKIKDLI